LGAVCYYELYRIAAESHNLLLGYWGFYPIFPTRCQEAILPDSFLRVGEETYTEFGKNVLSAPQCMFYISRNCFKTRIPQATGVENLAQISHSASAPVKLLRVGKMLESVFGARSRSRTQPLIDFDGAPIDRLED